MGNVPMITEIKTDFGSVWSRAAYARLQGSADPRATEASIYRIASRWAFRSWCRDHPLEDLIVNIQPSDTPLLSRFTRKLDG